LARTNDARATFSAKGRVAFCTDISSGRVDPVADGRADAGTDGGAVPGVVARAESTRRMSVGTPPTPVGCANPGVVTHADPVADDRAASVADDRAAFVANGRVDPVADGRADSGTEVALCSSLALRE
jgi:hypothetical protein